MAAAMEQAMIGRRIGVRRHETLARRQSDTDHPMTVAQDAAMRETR